MLKDILRILCEDGLEAVNIFERRFLKNKTYETAICRKLFTLPSSTNIISRANWGELTSRYVFWAYLIEQNQLTQSIYIERYLADILLKLDRKEQIESAAYFTGLQVLKNTTEDVILKAQRYKDMLCEVLNSQ